VPSEYAIDLCFIRPDTDTEGFHAEIEQEMERIVGKSGKWYAERKKQDRLDVSVVQLNGLAALDTEAEVIEQLESRMASPCWDWLNGYRLEVIPKEEAGCCAMKRKQGSA
jgi:hypothetical protein